MRIFNSNVDKIKQDKGMEQRKRFRNAQRGAKPRKKSYNYQQIYL